MSYSCLNMDDLQSDDTLLQNVNLCLENENDDLNEIVSGDSIFCATGITSGDLVSGIMKEGSEFISETLVTHKSSKTKKIFKLKKKI